MSALDGKGTKHPNGIDVPVGKLFIDETAVTSSAAELNKLDGAGAVVASGTKASHIADIANDASGTVIATAVNAIIAALEAFNITANS
ncbi:MAG: hypothetical protein ACM3KR_00665 [Deltaproteobacteria bacterium]